MTDRRPEDEAPHGEYWTEGAPEQAEPPAWDQDAEAYPDQEIAAEEPQLAPADGAAAQRGLGGRWLFSVAVLIAFLAGAAAWPVLGPVLLAQLPPSWGLGSPGGSAVAMLETRVATLEERVSAIDALSRQVSEMEERLAQRPAPGAQDLAGRVDALDQELDGLARQVTALSERPATPAGNAPPGETTDRIAALESRLSDLQNNLEGRAGDGTADDVVARLSDRLAAIEQRLQQPLQAEQAMQALEQQDADLRQRLQQLESRIAGIAEQSEAARAGSRRDALVLAVSQLAGAVRGGGSYEAALEAVRALGSEDQALSSALAPLAGFAEQGIPGQTALRARFGEMANAVVRAASTGSDTGLVERVRQRLASLVTVRRTGEVAGDTAEAIVARAEVALARGDLGQAVATLEQLQGAAAEAASPWLQDAKAWLAAEAALETLAARAVAMVAG